MRKFGFFLLFFVVGQVLLAQHLSTDFSRTTYSPDFEFKEGIYLVMKDFRNNDPLPLDSVISPFDANAEDFIKDVLDQEELTYSFYGRISKIPTSKLWGYSSNANVYIQIQNDFNRIITIGRICHFVATITSFVPVYSSGMYSFGMPNGGGVTHVPSTEIKQLVLDFNTGKTLDFIPENLEILIKDNPTLLKEFEGLSLRKKKEKLHSFLLRYNEAFPIYFPE
jgi:hypothetical protein